jgi:hypothetical protein
MGWTKIIVNAIVLERVDSENIIIESLAFFKQNS